MNGVITEIRKQAKRRDRYSVFVDNEFAFSVAEETLARLGLQEGQTIDLAKVNEIVAADNEAKAFAAALRYLSLRDRSAEELRRKLGEKGYDEQAVTNTLNRLAKLGYLDDVRFAQSWVRRSLEQRPTGRRKLRNDLLQKGIDRDTVDQIVSASLDETQERELAMRLARQKMGLAGNKVDGPAAKQKIASLLYRRGFDWETIEAVVHELLGETE